MNITKKYGFIFKHFLLSKILIFSVIYFTLLVSYPITNEEILFFNIDKLSKVFEIIFSTGDTGWYQGIVQNGYTHELYNAKEQRNWAYFPLFPFILNVIGNDYIVWFLLQITIILSGILLYKIVKFHFSEDIAKWSVIFYMYWPWAYMQSSLRPEALLTLFWLMTYFTFLNKNYYISASFAFFSALLKPNGFLISFLAFLYLIKFYKEDDSFKIKNYIKPLIVIIAGPLGIILYSIYMFNITGDFLAWAKIQSTWGSEFLTQPISQLKQLITSPMFIDRWGWDSTFFNWIFFGLFIFIMINLFKYSPYLAIFGIVVSFLSILNFGVWVHGRHLSTVFPLFIGLALVIKTEKNKYSILNLFIICIVMFSIFSALGINAFKA